MAADGSIVIQVDLDTDNAEKEYSKLKTQIKRTADEINDLQQKKSPLVEQAEQLRQRLKAAQAEADRFGEQWQQGVIGADQKQTEALETVRDLEYQYEQIVKQIDKIDEKLLPNIQKYERMTNEAGELRKEISQTAKNTDKAAKNAEKMGKAVQKASRQAQTFSQRMKNLLRQVIEFGIIFGAYGAFTNWLWTAVKANDEAAASMARFKAATLTAVQPLLNVLIPAFSQLVNVATQVMAVFARLTAAIFGTTVEESADAAEGLWNEQNAIEGVGEAAKKTTKQLAAFDEINKLMGDTSNSASTPEVDIKDPIVPDFSGIKDIKLPEWLEGIVSALELKISDIRFELSDGLDWEDDTTLITALGTIVGGLIGGTLTRGFGGLIIGALAGAGLSLYLTEFTDDGSTKTIKLREMFDSVLEDYLLPAALGAVVFGSLTRSTNGLVIGAVAGVALSLFIDKFKEADKATKNSILEKLTPVLESILEIGLTTKIFKSLVTGQTGGLTLTLTLAAILSLGDLSFEDGKLKWTQDPDFWPRLMSGIVSSILGITASIGLQKGVGGVAKGAALSFSVAVIAEIVSTELIKAIGYKNVGGAVLISSMVMSALAKISKGGFVTSGAATKSKQPGTFGIMTAIEIGVTTAFFKNVLNGENYSAAEHFINSALVADILSSTLKTFGVSAKWAAGISVFTIPLTYAITWTIQNYNDEARQEVEESFEGVVGDYLGKVIFGVEPQPQTPAGTPQNASTWAAKNTGYVAVNMDDIPFMASGGVIPPNRPFLAVLGDQPLSSGTNIEAPLDTIVQAMQIALANGNGGKNEAVFEVDGNVFARLVYQYGSRENNRIGVSLAGGMA